MLKKTLVLTAMLCTYGCAGFDQYVRDVSGRPSLLIGYQTVELRDNIPPIFELQFANNSSRVDDEQIDQIGEVLTDNSYYVVEATAGGYTAGSQNIVKQRVKAMIEILESYGVNSDKIYVAEYSAAKPGLRGYIYSVSY